MNLKKLALKLYFTYTHSKPHRASIRESPYIATQSVIPVTTQYRQTSKRNLTSSIQKSPA